jgi:hypothetical protein
MLLKVLKLARAISVREVFSLAYYREIAKSKDAISCFYEL